MPIIKEEKRDKVEKYKGITLMSSAYRIYATILMGRLKEEIERGGIIPPNQTGFREEMGTINNIYVLNYLVNKQLGKKKRLVALFVDLKA